MSVERRKARRLDERFQVRLSDGLRDQVRAEATANDRSMNAEIVRMIEKGLASPALTATAPLTTLPPSSLAGIQGELFALPDLDAFERKVGIVERTNRIFGVSAARRLWPMLGLPDLRTSDDHEDESGRSQGPKGRNGGGVPRDGPSGVRGEGESGKAPLPASGKLALFRPWVARFIRECCEPEPKAIVSAYAFRETYVQWAALHGAPLTTPSVMGRYAAELGMRRHKSGGATVYLDVKLRAPELPGAAIP